MPLYLFNYFLTFNINLNWFILRIFNFYNCKIVKKSKLWVKNKLDMKLEINKICNCSIALEDILVYTNMNFYKNW